MMRALSIVALVLGLAFIITTVVYASKVASLRSAMYMEQLFSYDDSGYSYGGSDDAYAEMEETTQMGAIITALFLAFFEAVFVLSLMKIKTKTAKIISIIGMSLNGIFLAWSILPAASPSSVSFDEVGFGFLAHGVVVLAFMIITTIHAFKTNS